MWMARLLMMIERALQKVKISLFKFKSACVRRLSDIEYLSKMIWLQNKNSVVGENLTVDLKDLNCRQYSVIALRKFSQGHRTGATGWEPEIEWWVQTWNGPPWTGKSKGEKWDQNNFQTAKLGHWENDGCWQKDKNGKGTRSSGLDTLFLLPNAYPPVKTVLSSAS